MNSFNSIRNKYLKEIKDGGDNDLETYPDFDEMFDFLKNEIDDFLVLLEMFSKDLDDEDDSDFYTSNFIRLDGESDKFIISLKSFLTLLKLRGDKESE